MHQELFMKKVILPSNKPLLLCDENLPRLLVKLLENEGFDVFSPSYLTSVEKIAFLEKTQRRVIVTFDRHFANKLLL